MNIEDEWLTGCGATINGKLLAERWNQWKWWLAGRHLQYKGGMAIVTESKVEKKKKTRGKKRGFCKLRS